MSEVPGLTIETFDRKIKRAEPILTLPLVL
jgi:hypothetical protein